MSANAGTATIVALRNAIKNMVKGEDIKINPDVIAQGKLTKLMSNFVVRPRVVLSNSLKYLDENTLKDIVKTELTIFTAYLSQAFKIMISIYGVNASAAVYNLGGSGNIVSSVSMGIESKDYLEDLFKADTLDDIMLGNEGIRLKYNTNKVSNVSGGPEFNTDLEKALSKNFGMFEVSLSFPDKNGNKRVLAIPIIVNPVILFTDTKELVDELIDDTTSTSLFSRIDEYRSGAISLKDLIFATDLVKEYKNKRIKNDNDVTKLLKDINNINTVKGIALGKLKFNTNYNIYIFDSKEKAILDAAAEGDIYKPKYKNTLTNNLSAFSISLVDSDKERLVTLMADNMPPSVLTFKMLKNSKDVDVNDVFKNLLLNKPPF